jgi:hypothetical protein
MTQQRRRWTDEDITKLKSMAKKYPSAQIASEIGRGTNSVRTKAHELAVSLRVERRHRETPDVRASGSDLPSSPRR